MISDFVLQRQAVTRYVRDALQSAVDKQKENADKRGERGLLSTTGIRDSAVTNLGASKLAPRFIRPFTVLKDIGDAYTLDIPTSLRLHPTFYVGRLKRYHPATIPEPAQPTEPGDLPDSAVDHGLRASTSAAEQESLDSAGEAAQSPYLPQEGSGAIVPYTDARVGHRERGHNKVWRREEDSRGQPCVQRSSGYLQLCQQQEGSRHAGNARVLPPEEDTWEPRANLLHDVPDVVEAYESKVAATNITADQYAVSTNANEDGCLSDHVNVIENDDLSDHENENENETETDDLSDHVYVIETDSLGDHVMSVGASRLDSRCERCRLTSACTCRSTRVPVHRADTRRYRPSILR
ncbi:hypothetical protein PC129_g18828 [Phytophthora cactorum]|uniref:Tf2-1-like SH3-like domain-containing protein n=1 Tax=Phytophthora cactorum TaxID=29920 RepID=A0A8T1HDN5_9STRA|nr:hypothetical protein PC129_g18828 [Phytophthora cactorum]